MNSLAVRLTLGFVLIGIIGAVLVAVITGRWTRAEFDRFVANSSQQSLIDTLSAYYSSQGSWQGVERLLAGNSLRNDHLILVDAQGQVVIGPGPASDGRPYPYGDLTNGLPIEVDGQTVGVLFMRDSPPFDNRGRVTPETAFLSNVTLASILSALIATFLALALGAALTRTLMRPIRALTEATQAMAAGQLGLQVEVETQDEIGRLADSFNRMSTDLARASRTQKQMTADIAHDLRTPLSILRGYTEGLKEGAIEGDPRLYNIMHEEVVHLERLVNDLRTLSLADAGALTLNRRSVDPKALLERTGLKYVMTAEQAGIQLRLEAPDDLPSISADLDRMTQVLNNLVSNALQYTSSGEIVLSAMAAGDQVQLQVRDSGVGIAPEDVPHVFDRFYRADKARQRGPQAASGLGLAIAKALVEAHGGAISVASTPGEGTTFTISLPTASA